MYTANKTTRLGRQNLLQKAPELELYRYMKVNKPRHADGLIKLVKIGEAAKG